jgi:polysaccharide export outer membrane protein
MNYKFLLLLMLSLCLLGCSSKPPPMAMAPTMKKAEFEEIKIEKQSPKEIEQELKALQKLPPEIYRISSGDRFDFKVFDNQELNATALMVAPDGVVSFGLIGSAKIGGLTLVEATNMLQEKYKKFIANPRIALIPTRIQSSTFTICGQIINPGRYPLRNNARVADAIAIAQGLSTGQHQGDTVEMADLKNAFLVRDGKTVPVDFAKAIKEGDKLHNVYLRNGDYIYIPSSMNQTVYVLGEVGFPGYLGFKDNMTLANAIAFSRGLLVTASEDVLIVRGNLKDPKVYKVNIDKVFKGQALDFPLEPSDVVFVPKGGLSEYNVYVKKIIPTLAAFNLVVSPIGQFMGQ